MRCYRKILRISYKDHVTNEEVNAKIQQTIGPHEDPLTIGKRRKLQWCGHVFRSLGLAKTILQGIVKGGWRQGRQRKRWEDNTGEWSGLEFAKSQRAVENRGKWMKLVVKSSVVPQRPSRLRDRWIEGEETVKDKARYAHLSSVDYIVKNLESRRCVFLSQISHASVSLCPKKTKTSKGWRVFN